MSFYDSSDEEKNSDDDFPRKRPRRSKEDQMLGVFGSDSDEDRSSRLNRKTFHNQGVSFQKAGHLSSEDDDEARPSFGSWANNQDDSLRSGIALGSSGPTDEHASKELEAGQKRNVPVFGLFTDSPKPFIPSSNPLQSTQTAYAEYKRSTSQYKPADARKVTRTNTEKTPAKLMHGKAAQMMAKMGYKPGEGLGTSGKGIVNPIEAKLRPGQKAGLGSMSERTEQEMENEQRKSSKRPPQTSESRQPRQARSDAVRKQKVRYKTSKEIADEAGGGLKIPPGLESILDMTGGRPRMINHSDDLQTTEVNTHANESYRISQSARKDVERLAAEWRELQDRKIYLAAEHKRTQSESDRSVSAASNFEQLIVQVNAIRSACDETYDEWTKLSRLTDGLEILQAEFSNEIVSYRLDEVAVALLTPYCKQAMASWNVLSDPRGLVGQLQRLVKILRVPEIRSDLLGKSLKRQALHFESFMSMIWFPRIRSSLGTDWDTSESSAVLALLTAWSNLISPFLNDQILEELVMPRLLSSVRKWNPRSTGNKTTLSFLFQWLPLLGEKVPDLIAVVRRRFVSVLDQWTPKDGVINDLYEWREVLSSSEMDSILLKSVLPKLAEALRRDFVVEPADQNLVALEAVFLWKHNFTPATIGQLLETEFFPKWLQVLYLWLKGEPNFEEISLWYEWWRDVIPKDLHFVPAVRKGFTKALEMMDYALDHGTESLPIPNIGPTRPMDHSAHVQSTKAATKPTSRTSDKKEDEEISFKDVIEDWCAQQNFLLLPLRKAHGSGNSLFKITASAIGTGGVTVYFRGDIVMMQAKQKGTFSPASLQEVAAAVA